MSQRPRSRKPRSNGYAPHLPGQELQASILEGIFAQNHILLAYLDRDFNFVMVNRAYAEADARAPGDFIGKNHFDFYPHAENEAIFRRVIATGTPHFEMAKPFVYARSWAGGTTYWDWSLVPVKDKGGNIIGVVLALNNVTAHMHALQLIRRSEERYRQLTEQAADGILVCERSGRLLAVNSQLCNLLQYTRTDLLSRALQDLLPPRDGDGGDDICSIINTGPELQQDRLIRRDGELIPVEINANTLPDGRIQAIVRDIRARREQERDLRLKNSALESSLTAIAFADLHGRLTYVNRALTELYGYTAAELLGQPVLLLTADPDEGAQALAAAAEGRWAGELRGRRKNGRIIHTYVTAHVVRDENGAPVCLMGSVTDITEQRAAAAEMSKLSRALEQTADMVLITDRSGIIEYVNPAFERIAGYRREQALGQRPNILKSGKQSERFYSAMWETIRKGKVFSGVLINRRYDGSEYFEEKTITPLKDDRGEITHYISTGRDISDRILVQERLHRLAHHDVLTELPNRLLFTERLKQAMALARRHRHKVAVMFLDLDRFKVINDTLGHDVGDSVLQALSQRLVATVRTEDTVARLGGDEFAIIVERVACADEPRQIAGKLLRALELPFQLGEREFYVTTSIGISMYPEHGADAQTLIKHADTAMYWAKSQGRNTYQYYADQPAGGALERLTLETELRRALERRAFHLEYQPQVNLHSGNLTGLEALLRWEHPALGVIAPARFIAVAEEIGLGGALGVWTLDQVCAQIRRWIDAGYTPPRVAINVSARQFRQPELVDIMRGALDEYGLNGNDLEIEITEGALLENLDVTKRTLHALKDLGAQLSVDDFGTGYSSLSYLQQFPLDTLKVDRSFVQHIGSDAHGAAIPRAVIALGHSLDLGVLAEGVETETQREWLLREGCDRAQGYLFARPLPPEKAGLLLETRCVVRA